MDSIGQVKSTGPGDNRVAGLGLKLVVARLLHNLYQMIDRTPYGELLLIDWQLLLASDPESNFGVVVNSIVIGSIFLTRLHARESILQST